MPGINRLFEYDYYQGVREWDFSSARKNDFSKYILGLILRGGREGGLL